MKNHMIKAISNLTYPKIQHRDWHHIHNMGHNFWLTVPFILLLFEIKVLVKLLRFNCIYVPYFVLINWKFPLRFSGLKLCIKCDLISFFFNLIFFVKKTPKKTHNKFKVRLNAWSLDRPGQAWVLWSRTCRSGQWCVASYDWILL